MDNTSRIIKEIRTQLGLGQAELAKELGVSFATVNRWERGHFAPSPVALRALKQFCRERGIRFEQYEENYRDRLDVDLRLYAAEPTGALFDELLLDHDKEGERLAEKTGVLVSTTLTLTDADVLYLTNATDFLFLTAYRRGVLKKEDAPERFGRIEALLEGCDIVVTYGITKDLSALLDRFYRGEITDRALGACLSLYTVGQGYLLISERAKHALSAYTIETVNREAPEGNTALLEVLKKHRRDGFYFDEIVDTPTK